MPYVTSIERLAIEEGEKIGLEKGRQQGRRPALAAIAGMLKLKFGDRGTRLMPKVRKIKDPDDLTPVIQLIDRAKTVDEVRDYFR